MGEWAVCPACALRHSRRADGICPRCQKPVDPAFTASPAFAPSAEQARRGPTARMGAPAGDDGGRKFPYKFVGAVVVLGLLCFVAGPWAVDRITRRTVWAINGLDIPLEVTVAGERMRVAANGYASAKTSAKDLEFVARTVEGQEVDRLAFRPSFPDSKVAFNVLGAASLYVKEAIYVPESRQHGPVFGSGKLWEETFDARQVVELTNIDFFLDPPPPTIKADPDNPGQKDLRALYVDGGWRTTARNLARDPRRAAAAFKFVQGVAAAEPLDADAREMLIALTPPPPRVRPSPPGLTGDRWDAVATLRLARAWVTQRPIENGRCVVRCDGGGREWVTNECLSKAGDFRFTTPDCERLIVVRPRGEGTYRWRQTPVVFIYRRGQLESQLTTEDFISHERLIERAADHFLWMKEGARLSADRGAVEFETRDGRTQRVPLIPGAP
jgi:hypothetical protein